MVTLPHELILHVVLLVLVLADICLSYTIGLDANARGSNGTLWGAFAFVLLPVAAPTYLLYRTRLPARAESPSEFERAVGSVGIGGLAAAVASVFVAPPDLFSWLFYVLPIAALFARLTIVVCYEPGWRALVARTRLRSPR